VAPDVQAGEVRALDLLACPAQRSRKFVIYNHPCSGAAIAVADMAHLMRDGTIALGPVMQGRAAVHLEQYMTSVQRLHFETPSR
jgi:hypothetical protein